MTDESKQFFFCLACVVFNDGFFFFKIAGAAGKAVDCLPRHLIELGVKRLGKKGVEFIILEKVIGRLPVAVGGKEPCGKGAVAVSFEYFLRFFDSFAVEDYGLVCDCFDFRGKRSKGFEVGVAILRFADAECFENRF